MGDWDAVKSEAERLRREQAAMKDQAARAEQERTTLRAAAASALRQRLEEFQQGLDGHLYVSFEFRSYGEAEPPDSVRLRLGRKSFKWALPDREITINITDEGDYWTTSQSDFGSIEGALPDVMAGLVECAGQIVADVNAPVRTKVEHLGESLQALAWGAYGLVSVLVGIVSFFWTWFAVGSTYGLAGVLLGWIPGLVVGVLVGFLWGPAIIVGLLWWIVEARKAGAF